MSAEKTEVLFHVLDYLSSLKTESNADGVDTIISLIESEFDVEHSAENFKKFSLFPTSLAEVIPAGKKALNAKEYNVALAEMQSNPKFESFVSAVVSRGYFEGVKEDDLDYLQRYAKLLSKFSQKLSQPSVEDAEKQAEEYKLKGNAAINAKDYQAAVDYYGEALKLSSEGPSSHVYFSNRAAAYCHLNKYKEAVDDCLSSVTLSPDYVKAYSRLGLSYFFLEKYEEAVDAYERAAELEPDNKGTQDSLRQAKNKLKKIRAKETDVATPTAAASTAGMPGCQDS
jgi:small glutamine-rich tetratricopeptide repeat-containing protein alpha